MVLSTISEGLISIFPFLIPSFMTLAVTWMTLYLMDLGNNFAGFNRMPKKPRLICNKAMKKKLQANMPVVKEDFAVMFGTRSGQAQSILLMFDALPWGFTNFHNDTIETRGGRLLRIYWNSDITIADDEVRPVVAYFPGVGHSAYRHVSNLFDMIREKNYRGVIVNYPGRYVPMKAPDVFWSFDGKDLKCVIDYIRSKTNNGPLILMGASMGCTMIANYLTNFPEEAKQKVAGVMAISMVFDFNLTDKFLNSPVNGLLTSWGLTANYLLVLFRNRSFLQKKYGLQFSNYLKFPLNFPEFVRRYCYRHIGVKTKEEFTALSSLTSLEKLEKIPVPFLCVNAMDDLFHDRKGIPEDLIPKTENVAVLLTETGGHCAFFDEFPFSGKPQYLQRVLDQFTSMIFEDME